MEAMEQAPEPFWCAFKDEELLALRICDLGVRIEHSELNPRIEQLYDELAARGVSLRPDCYLGDEWFSPEGVPAISIPFYLAHPLPFIWRIRASRPSNCTRCWKSKAAPPIGARSSCGMNAAMR